MQPCCRQKGAMYASKAYVETFGMPSPDDNFAGHRFLCHDSDTARAPFDQWIRENVSAEQLTFRATEQTVLQRALCEGAGIGYMPLWDAANYPDLVQVMPPDDAWSAPLWLVTHVDLHRTTKVQTFTAFLKEEARSWPVECAPR